MTTADFYDSYHQKNDRYSGVIRDNNFTYFYIQQTLHEACILLPKKSWQGMKVLDVGCGVGALSLYLASKGAKVTGIDISPRAISIAQEAAVKAGLQKRVTFSTQTLRKAAKGTYDFVLCSEVIEHIPDDVTFIKQLTSQLKPGGVLMLTTPSLENTLYKLGYYQKFDEEVGHERRYTKKSLEQLVKKSGLRTRSLRAVEGPLRNILFTSFLGFIIRFIKGPLVPLFHVFDRGSAMAFGASDLQILAQK